MLKTYSELLKYSTFDERLEYLRLSAAIGVATFGYDRYLNQMFYSSREWKRVRRDIIIRDNGCDLGVDGYPVDRGIVIHHIEPITKDDILNRSDKVFDPENLISVSMRTHNSIHYGTSIDIPTSIERFSGDTTLWR